MAKNPRNNLKSLILFFSINKQINKQNKNKTLYQNDDSQL